MDEYQIFILGKVAVCAFSRGVEWAAIGKVKQKLPIEFPTETTVLLRDLDQLLKFRIRN